MTLNRILKPLDHSFKRGEDPLLLANNSSVQIISGRRGAGKSTLLLCLLQSKKAYRGRFDNVYLVSPTAATDAKFERLVGELQAEDKFFDKLDQPTVEEIFERIQSANDEGRRQKRPVKPLHLLILDDCVCDLPKSRSSVLDRIVIQSRHHNVSLIITSQKYNLLNRTLRANADLISFFPSLNSKEVASFQEDLNISPHVFYKLYNKATDSQNSFLHCNLLAFPPRFYRCFERIHMDLLTGDDLQTTDECSE